MSWRTVVVTKHCKLEQKMGYLICRGETTQKVHLSEITALVVESTAVSITAPLLCELIKNKIIVLFCDENHNPHSQLLPLNGSHDACKKLKQQVDWDADTRAEVWTRIIGNKIKQQADFLQELGSGQAELLYTYIENIEKGDVTNREGHAAKVYFNALLDSLFLPITIKNTAFTNTDKQYSMYFHYRFKIKKS